MTWRKSSRSGSGAQCVEFRSDRKAVRDSKNPAGPFLVANLAAFTAEVKAGRFDA
jgi:hypothetical protein